MNRIAAFGHGQVEEASAEEALAHANEQDPIQPDFDSEVPSGVNIGDSVLVTPTDYGKVPVAGTLVAASSTELVLERETPEASRLMTHFPNIGFQISRA